MPHLVLAYGTLKRGFSNHAAMAGALFVGVARTEKRFALYCAAYPLVTRMPAVSPISGEVFAVDDAILQLLDEVEDHPRLYRRELEEVRLAEGGEVLRAWIYFGSAAAGELLPSGEFTDRGWRS